MSAEELLTKFDYDKFIWRQSSANESQHFQRALAGSEVVQELWNRVDKGHQTLFFAVHLRLATPQSEAAIQEVARRSWIHLRHQTPIVATTCGLDENEFPLLKYAVPDVNQVREWAARTLIVHTQATIDLNGLREELGYQKIPSAAGDQTWMHLVVASSSTEVEEIGLVFHTAHAPTDGNGAKIILHGFLSEFAKQLGSTASEEQLIWGDEIQRLAPALFTVLNADEPLLIKPGSNEEPSFAHPAYGTLGAAMQSIVQSMQNAYGFKHKEGDKSPWPAYHRAELVFGEQESKSLLGYLQDQPYTMAVLAHAALAMVVVHFNPPSVESAGHTLSNWTMLDVRHRLKEPFSSRHGYTGYGIAPPRFSLPLSLFFSDETLLPLDKAMLLKLMDDARERYKLQRELPPGYFPLAAELFVAQMKMGYAANMIPPNQCYSFSSDGRGENKLDLTYKDKSGKAVFEITKFWTSVSHPYPAPYFRVSSWQGVIDLGADYNENLTLREEVNRWLAKWREFMLLFVQ
ncbi:hypothetical protein FB45DRAFT_928857 [Roridomyces roridus]|uniref:Uncharacterized protein n=1 Tax=Roridomyces roridus TaxID=1738132 RepID=A0AAD7BHU6_9AGAR|nr:hypothetical protein FB45DRAFT_928857 [Roridomyces roridus]